MIQIAKITANIKKKLVLQDSRISNIFLAFFFNDKIFLTL